ncbi:MAG: hypothetical protein DIZ80_00595 [endosymbiont of Galathealinum brachiosum]|uniref:Flagellar Assembly Protein A N-terminal region domain-containing protein n=1 Tax=endosymbiont of Galathealinum brachiosum TaxID=2200906 RepID=A0A370DM65_9GAMM|nr:MAG: hypothetical protein DIZ80_00595 [endosymbiont of Galathealinum brachiosum]
MMTDKPNTEKIEPDNHLRTDKEHSAEEKNPEPASAGFKLQVSDDQLSVYIRDITPASDGGDALSIEMIAARLKSKKISAPVNKENIEAIIEAPGNTLSDEQACIVQGKPPVESQDAIFTLNIPEKYLNHNCAVVLPDDVVATYREAINGTPGKNVYGKVIKVSPGKKVKIQTGAGIKITKNQKDVDYIATNLGVIDYEHTERIEKISLSSSVNIAEGNMQACMDIYAKTVNDVEITTENIIEELNRNKVSFGFDEVSIQTALSKALNITGQHPVSCVSDVVVANGLESEPCKDAKLIISLDKNTIGAEIHGGYIDYHEQGYPWNVSEGDRAGYLLKAKPGVEGKTVRGVAIKVKKPREIKLKLQGLHIDEKGRLVADMDGALIVSNFTLKVIDLLVIDKVDYEKGNINSNIPVHVKGSIRPGFIIESDDSVIIEYNVEDSTIRAEGDIVIKGGIRGVKSRVYSPSNINVGFIENAKVFVNGVLTVTGSILNSTVASNDTIRVGVGNPKHSMVAGGEITANNHLEVSELGSDGFVKTVVHIGVAQEERRKIRLIDDDIEKNILNLKKVDQLETRHRIMPVKETKDIIFKLQITRKALVDTKQKLEEKKLKLIEEIKDKNVGNVRVNKFTYPGVIIFIQDKRYKVSKKLEAGSFVYDRKSDKVRFIKD